MIDLQNARYLRLHQIPVQDIQRQVADLLITGEEAVAAYKGLRDYVVFTSKRVIAVDVQGLTGKKRDYTSLPFSKVQAFSVETAGFVDLDSELELWFSELGRVRFEFTGNTDVAYLRRLVGGYVL